MPKASSWINANCRFAGNKSFSRHDGTPPFSTWKGYSIIHAATEKHILLFDGKPLTMSPHPTEESAMDYAMKHDAKVRQVEEEFPGLGKNSSKFASFADDIGDWMMFDDDTGKPLKSMTGVSEGSAFEAAQSMAEMLGHSISVWHKQEVAEGAVRGTPQEVGQGMPVAAASKASLQKKSSKPQ